MDIFAFIQRIVCYTHMFIKIIYYKHIVMSKIVIKNGIKWDYDFIWNRYTFIEKVKDKPKKKKKGEDN